MSGRYMHSTLCKYMVSERMCQTQCPDRRYFYLTYSLVRLALPCLRARGRQRKTRAGHSGRAKPGG